MVENPYIEIQHNSFTERTFGKNLHRYDLKWHFDEQDRLLLCKESNGWLFQYDRGLPFEFKGLIFVRNGIYHRLIKPENCFKGIKVLIWKFHIKT